jgi:hypothetical protein
VKNILMFLGNDTKIKAIAFLVAALTVVVYLPALQNGFVNWDDQLYVYENPYIRSLDLNFIQWMFSFQDTLWVPVTRLSHALNYAVWELNPMGYHLTNIIFHGLNTFLVVILVVCLIDNSKFTDPSASSVNQTAVSKNALFAGGLTGILFGLHPIHVESVAWITERKDVLSVFFVLLSLLYYLKFVTISLNRKRRLNYILSLIFFTMALLSKPMVVTLPFILIILDFYPLQRLNVNSGQDSIKKVLMEKIPFFALSLSSTLTTFLLYEYRGIEVTKISAGLADRLLISIHTLFFYLVKILWPLNLAPLYPYKLNVSVFSLKYSLSVILFITITAFCVYMWKRQKIWLTVWAFYIVTLLPVLGIIKFGYFAAADRYTYLPSLGPFLLIGLGITSIYVNNFKNNRLHGLKIFLVIVLFLIICFLSFLCIKQIKIWENTETLWNAQLKVFPDSHLAHMNLANEYSRDGRYDQAVEILSSAQELYPNDPEIYFNRGISYGKLGSHQNAIEDFNRAIELSHQDAKYYNELGVAYGSIGNFQQAIENLSLAINIDPQFSKAYFFRGIAYKRLGNNWLFLQDFQTAAQQGHKQAQDYLSTIGLE